MSNSNSAQQPELTDGEIIALANKALPGWTRQDNDLAYLTVVRAALQLVEERRAAISKATGDAQ